MKAPTLDCSEHLRLEGDRCAACSAPASRRDFLRDAGAGVIAILAGLGISVRANAMEIRFAQAVRTRGPEASYPIPETDGATIDKEHEVILVRWKGSMYAFRLSCPHQRTALKWREGDGRFQCPKHKSKYQPDGTFISGRATRGMDRYAIRRSGAKAIVDLSTVYQEDKSKSGWTSAVVRL
jgi:Rieske Fe-S protein